MASAPVTLFNTDVEMGIFRDNVTVSQPAVDEEDIVNSLFDAVRFGLRTQVTRLLEKHALDPSVLNQYNKGHTLAHWAAKKGDVEMLQLLKSHGASISSPSMDENKMYPIHWAAADNQIGVMRYMLNEHVDINATDANGCTPLTIAAQDGHCSLVVFLLKSDADPDICDVNGDSPLHWAAYKGHVEMVALLSRLLRHKVEQVDSYGQSMVHLAAMRGHLEVVEYVVTELRLNPSAQDANGATPADLAVKRSKTSCELYLKGLTAKNTWSYLQAIGFNNLTSARIFIPLLFGKNDRETFQWPFRLVLASLTITMLFTYSHVVHEEMADLYGLHMTVLTCEMLIWISLMFTKYKDPGFVSVTQQSAHQYEEALKQTGEANSEEDVPLMCHTCRIRRPLRSKHCKVSGKCVNGFDHFCPFVGNVVGRDNYKWFFMFLVTMTAGMTMFEITSVFYFFRVNFGWLGLFWDVYLFAFFMMVFGLFWYHSQLVLMNLTTNEHMNMIKYKYMRNQFGLLHNPFDKGYLANALDRLFPSPEVYYTREQAETANPQSNSSSAYQRLNQTVEHPGMQAILNASSGGSMNV